ncbi:MAG: LD-carboxypeptidase [bacterium]
MDSTPSAPPGAYRSPPLLHQGDSVALISPSSHMGRNPPGYLREAAEILAGWGLRAINGEEPEQRHLYLAGSDRQRARQFQAFYCDPAVKALFVTRGGYGAARMLPLLDGPAIAGAAPKPVVGFSDVTALFAWLHAVADIAVLHAPCLAAPSLLRSPQREAELEALRRALFEPEPIPPAPVMPLQPGRAEGAAAGRLTGGCLALLVTTLGTPWEPDTRDAILFLEDVGEAPYRIDRMLTHLRTAGKFDHLRGLVFGYLHDCDDDEPGRLREVLQDLFHDAPFPVALGLPAGHGTPNLPLWLGRQVNLRLRPADKPGADGGGSLTFL